VFYLIRIKISTHTHARTYIDIHISIKVEIGSVLSLHNEPVLQLRISTPIRNQVEKHLFFCQCYSVEPCLRKGVSM